MVARNGRAMGALKAWLPVDGGAFLGIGCWWSVCGWVEERKRKFGAGSKMPQALCRVELRVHVADSWDGMDTVSLHVVTAW
jgi:hypothetical protein